MTINHTAKATVFLMNPDGFLKEKGCTFATLIRGLKTKDK